MPQEFSIQLYEAVTNIALTVGGKFKVVTAGTYKAIAITDLVDAAATNPKAISSGNLSFRCAETVSAVDIYGYTDSGYAFQVKNVQRNNIPNIYIDLSRKTQVIQIPWDATEPGLTAASEFDSGFDLVTNTLVLPDGVSVYVATADATETIDVGILSGESGGDADGIGALVSVANVATVAARAVVTTGSNTKFFASTTLGALIADFQAGTDVDQDEGMFYPRPYRCDGTAKSISYTLSTGSDTGSGIINIPTQIF